ncbi:MAG: Uma2 family endonuclease [Verrucomicrobiales bacterium]|nr:Uma2 family endonuclease [Verrucomicrobiales bacterium]MBP9223038.1 Uma2 family endonuclease [Verrucomicrobiales bacterium]
MSAVSYKPHYRIEDYLLWGGDWELWDGIPVSMSPSPNFFHQSVGSRLLAQLIRQLASEGCPDDCEALYEIDWHADRNTVVRPDLVIICEKPEGQWITRRPEFVAEILSPSTRQKDLTAKRELYAANGVPFYLILDPDDKSALLLTLKSDGSYGELAPEEPFELHPGCRLQLEVAPLFT